jgi:hypothetical protein
MVYAAVPGAELNLQENRDSIIFSVEVIGGISIASFDDCSLPTLMRSRSIKETK